MIKRILMKKYAVITLLLLELFFLISLFKLPATPMTIIPAGLSVLALPVSITLLLQVFGWSHTKIINAGVQATWIVAVVFAAILLFFLNAKWF